MLIDITKIKTENRIRKDFGNIQELADDIKQNGLINPPVVIAETDGTFTLLAGERRLRAMKSLGYRQVEVRTWGSLTDEQKLNIEISENEVRKDFSKAERIEYARRLEKIESVKARERQATSTGGVNPQLSLKSDEAGRTDEIVAERLGIGGKDTYRKEKYIVDNADTLTPKEEQTRYPRTGGSTLDCFQRGSLWAMLLIFNHPHFRVVAIIFNSYHNGNS